MRKSLITIAATLFAAASLTSCNSDPSFGFIDGRVDIYQNFGESPSASFMAHVYFIANEDITAGSISHNDLPLTASALPAPYSAQGRYAETAETGRLSDALGTYQIRATGPGGEEAYDQIAVNYSDSRLMGKLEVESFEYADGRVKAKIRRQENIWQYGFYVVVENNTVLAMNGMAVGVEANRDPEFIEIYHDLTGSERDKKLTISVAAYQQHTTGFIVQRSVTRTLEADATEFTEGNYPQSPE